MVHGLPLWAISIGLIDDGEPVLGVIAIPPLGELYWAVKGQGAWLDGQRLQAHDADVFHPQDNVCVGTNALRAIDPRSLTGRLRDLGSACCEQVFVAASRLQACTFLGEATHDVAAGVVISSEAGCAFGTLDGEQLASRRDGPPHADRHAHLRGPAAPAAGASAHRPRPLPPREGA